jgi:hypothetical protein
LEFVKADELIVIEFHGTPFLSFRRHPRIKRSEAYIPFLTNSGTRVSSWIELEEKRRRIATAQENGLGLILKLRLWGSVELVCKDYTNDSYYRRYRKYWY